MYDLTFRRVPCKLYFSWGRPTTGATTRRRTVARQCPHTDHSRSRQTPSRAPPTGLGSHPNPRRPQGRGTVRGTGARPRAAARGAPRHGTAPRTPAAVVDLAAARGTGGTIGGTVQKPEPNCERASLALATTLYGRDVRW